MLHFERLGALPTCFDHANRDGVEDQGAFDRQVVCVQPVPFFALDPADGRCVGRGIEHATHDPAKIIGDNVMVPNAIAVAMDAIEELYEFDGLDFEAGLLEDLAHYGLSERLTHLDEAAGNGPAPQGGLRAALDEEHAAVFHDDGAYTDERCEGVFALKHASTIERWAVSRIIDGLKRWGGCIIHT